MNQNPESTMYDKTCVAVHPPYTIFVLGGVNIHPTSVDKVLDNVWMLPVITGVEQRFGLKRL